MSKSKKTLPLTRLPLDRWREYGDILTDSLWLFEERDRGGVHAADYHGNFIPQIPHQVMNRFTKPNDVVIDPFLGSGTTLIECRRLGRHGIGIELEPTIANEAIDRISQERNRHKVSTQVVGDSSDAAFVSVALKKALRVAGKKKGHLVLLHPPYHSIVRFSELPQDLSNCSTVELFLEKFGRVIDAVTPFLDKGHFLALVVGDIYVNRVKPNIAVIRSKVVSKLSASEVCGLSESHNANSIISQFFRKAKQIRRISRSSI